MRSASSAKKTAALLAFWIVLAQIALCLLVAPPSSAPTKTYMNVPFPPGWDESLSHRPVLGRYLHLANWDTFHFFSIARDGYRLPSHAVVQSDINGYQAEEAFFPAYPLTARLLSKLTGIRLEIAINFTAQMLAGCFWFFFTLLLFESGLDVEDTALTALALALQPGAFYLVAGYSESAFVAAIFGMIWLSRRYSRTGRARYAALGALLGAYGALSRLVGAGLAVFPFAYAFTEKGGHSRARGLVLVSAAGALGTIGYFGFCQARFGDWALYFKLQKIGWDNHANYWAFFNPLNYIPHYFFEDTVRSINRTMAPVCSVLLGRCLFAELKRPYDEGTRLRAGMYLLALALLFLTIAGKADAGMDGMLRYTFPVFALLLLAMAELKIELLGRGRALAYPFFLLVQAWIASRFLHGRWIS